MLYFLFVGLSCPRNGWFSPEACWQINGEQWPGEKNAVNIDAVNIDAVNIDAVNIDAVNIDAVNIDAVRITAGNRDGCLF
jgi:hypothetical protein